MKTSEFKKRVKELGYDILEHRDEYQVWEDEHKVNSDARIFKGTERIIALNTKNYTLIKLCIEYAETPIEEREGEKKYTVILPDSRINGEGKMIALKRNWEDRVVFSYSQIENIERYSLYHLTEAEIKRNHEYLWQFAKEVQE